MATAGKTVGFKDKDYVDNEFIDIRSAPDEEYLKGDGTWATAAEIIGVGLLLDTLGDVTLTSPADDDFLIYDTATSLWKNEASSTIASSIGLGTTDSVSFDALTLTGNLTVQGSTTTVDSTTMTVVDPLITLQTVSGGGPLTVDSNKDVGLGLQYFDGSSKIAFLGFDDSEGKLTFVPDATITNEVVTGAKGTIVADLEGTITAQGDTELYALSQVTSAANKGIQFTGSGTAATYDLTAAGKALLDDADAATQRLTLGLGSVATHSLSSILAIASGSASAQYSSATKKILKFGLGTIATHSLSSVVSMMSSTTSIGGMKDIDITGVSTNDIIVYDGIRWINQTPPNAAGLRALGLGTIATHSLSSVLALLGEPRLPNYITPTTRNILKTGLGTIATHSLSSVVSIMSSQVPGYLQHLSPASVSILKSGLGTIATHSLSSVVAMMSSTQSISGMKDIDITNATTNDVIVYDGIRWVNQTPPTARLSLGLGSIATHSLSSVLAIASGSASATYSPATKRILKSGLGTIATHSLSSVLGLMGEPRLPNYISPTTERILRQGLGTIATKSFASVLSSFDHNTTLKALQDTIVDSATVADNDFLIYNIGDSKWYNRSAATSRTKMGVAIGIDVFAQPSATGSLPLPVGTTGQQTGSQGAIRYNTTLSAFEGYNGSVWHALADPNVSSITRTTYTATGGETSVNVTYTINQLSVYLNGVKLLQDVDFTASNGTSITGLTALAATDHIDFVDYGIFNSSDVVPLSTGGTFLGDIFAPNIGTIASHSLSSVLAMAQASGTAAAERAAAAAAATLTYLLLEAGGGLGGQKLENEADTDDTNFIVLPNAADDFNSFPLTSQSIGVSVQAYDATIVVDADIGVSVQAYDATILVDADIGSTVQAYDATTPVGSSILVDADIGSTVQAYDSTIVVDADIGSTVQAYDATILVDADIGSTVQAYDSDLAEFISLNHGDSNFIVGTGSNWTVESGATVRLSLGLGSIATHSLSSVLAMASGSASASFSSATKKILKSGLGTIATHSLSSVVAIATHARPTEREVIALIDENVTPATDFVSAASGGTFLGNITVPATSHLLPSQISDATNSIANLDGSYTETIMIADVFNVVGAVVLNADFYMSKISDDGTGVTITGSGSITGSGTMGQAFPFSTGTPAEQRTRLELGTIATHSLSSVLAMASGSAAKSDFVSKKSGGTFLGPVIIPGGSIDAAPIGATTANTGTFTTLTATLGSINDVTVGAGSATTGAFTTISSSGLATLNSMSSSSVNIDGGTIDSTPIGATTANTGSFTTLVASGTVTGSNLSGTNTGDQTLLPSVSGTNGNLGVGITTLDSLTSGHNNVGAGDNALTSCTDGYQNTAIGTYAMENTTSANQNAAAGFCALRLNETGERNTAMGAKALRSAVTGDFNTAVGYYALYLTNGANWNTALGFDAGKSIVGGNTNTVLGAKAGDNITSGSSNIIIGYNIDADSATGSNQLNIGGVIKGDLSTNAITLPGTITVSGGNSGNWNTAYGWGNHASAGYATGSSPWTTSGSDIYFNSGNVGIGMTSGISEKLYVTGNISATGDITSSASDERLKENIKPINNAVEKIKQIKGITFDWINNIEEIVGSSWNDTTERHAGVLAQDVQKILPEVVRHAPFDLDEHKKSKSGKDYLTVKYEHLVPLLIEAIKEQQEQIDKLIQAKE